MKILRALYMIIGWVVVLPLLPFIMIGFFVFYKRITDLKSKDICVILVDQLITGIRMNLDFISNGL